MNKIEEAIRYFEYGIKCDIFDEPVLSYAKIAKLAIRGICWKSINEETVPFDRAVLVFCPVGANVFMVYRSSKDANIYIWGSNKKLKYDIAYWVETPFTPFTEAIKEWI